MSTPDLGDHLKHLQARDRSQNSALAENFVLNAIASGRYRAGHKLPTERMLSEQLGITRNAVRTALGRLEARGRVTRLVGSGTYVSMPVKGEKEVDAQQGGAIEASPLEIMETRLLVEPKLASLVVAHATSRDLERLHVCMTNAEAAKSFQDFELWDARLHQAIAEASHNRLMIGIYGTITAARDQTEWGELKRRSVTVERRKLYEAQHRSIVTALRARDAIRAEAAALEHLRCIRHNLLGI